MDSEEGLLLDLLFVQARNGIYNVCWEEATGLPAFTLTEKGKQEAVSMIKRVSTDPDVSRKLEDLYRAGEDQ